MLIINDWYNVGLQLDVKSDTLSEIEKSDPDFHTRKRKMFKAWLDSDPDASYHTLARALFRVGDNKTATDICTKYGKISSRLNSDVSLISSRPALQKEWCSIVMLLIHTVGKGVSGTLLYVFWEKQLNSSLNSYNSLY